MTNTVNHSIDLPFSADDFQSVRFTTAPDGSPVIEEIPNGQPAAVPTNIFCDMYDAYADLIPELDEQAYFDVLKNKPFINKRFLDPSEPDEFKEFDDSTLTKLRCLFTRRFFRRYNTARNISAADNASIAHTIIAGHKRNLFMERIETLEWDGTPRIDSFLRDMDAACEVPGGEKYLSWVSKAIFLSVIERQHHETKVDFIPILIGDQGIGKSTLCQKLAFSFQFTRSSATGWWTSSTSKMDDAKVFSESLDGPVIVELVEALQFKQDPDVFKAFVDKSSYTFRQPYNRENTTTPLHFIMMATSNKTELLSDTTGNRRFYPITLETRKSYPSSKKPIFNLSLETVEQLWAEALSRYEAGERWDDNRFEIYDMAEAIQSEHTMSYRGREELLSILDDIFELKGEERITYNTLRCELRKTSIFFETHSEDVENAIDALKGEAESLGYTKSKDKFRDSYGNNSRGLIKPHGLYKFDKSDSA